MRTDTPKSIERSLREWVSEWERLWRVPDLSRNLEIAFSPRLRRALGMAYPARRRIHLNVCLMDQKDQLRRVMLHEAAHVAAYALVGRTEAPHGPTWKRLVTLAGGDPRVVVRVPASAGRQARPRVRYLHTCSVCDFMRYAGRPMRRWRCADCVDAGRDGNLTIRKIEHARLLGSEK